MNIHSVEWWLCGTNVHKCVPSTAAQMCKNTGESLWVALLGQKCHWLLLCWLFKNCKTTLRILYFFQQSILLIFETFKTTTSHFQFSAQQWPKMSQDGWTWPQDGRRWAQDGPRWSKMAPRWPQDGPKMAPRCPRWPQDGPKMAQDGPRWPQVGPKMAQDGPKTAHPKMTPR